MDLVDRVSTDQSHDDEEMIVKSLMCAATDKQINLAYFVYYKETKLCCRELFLPSTTIAVMMPIALLVLRSVIDSARRSFT